MTRTQTRWLGFITLLLGFFALYAALRSPDLTAVDGPLRSVEVYHRQELFFHENNHLLYPAIVWGWNRLLEPMLGPSQDGLAFARRTQLMNGLALAVVVGLLFLLVHGATGSMGAAVGAASAYGFSRTVLLHATNAAEPPVGVMLSVLAVTAAAGSRDEDGRRAWLAAVAGVSLGAAMAVYQAMVLIGPAVLWLCAAPPTSRSADERRSWRIRARRVCFFLVGGVVAVASIYGFAYAHRGITGPTAQLQRFLAVDGGTHVYGGLSLSKVVNTPIGLVGNLFRAYSSDYAGLRSLLRDHRTDGWLIWAMFLLLVSTAVAWVLGQLVLRRWKLLGPTQRLAFGVAFAGLVSTLIGPLYWQPTYDKMWLLPMAAVTALAALGLSVLPSSRGRQVLLVACIGLLLVEVASNGWWTIPNAGAPTPYLREARQVSERLQPDDLLVHEWDKVSILYKALYGFGRPQFDLPTLAHARGAGVTDDLREMIRRTNAKGGRVYFLGILDLSQETWQPFLGDRLGVPYRALDEYRNHSTPEITFHVDGKPVSLRLCDATAC